MCLVLQKAKIQNIRVLSKERFIDEEGNNWNDGGFSGALNLS